MPRQERPFQAGMQREVCGRWLQAGSVCCSLWSCISMIEGKEIYLLTATHIMLR